MRAWQEWTLLVLLCVLDHVTGMLHTPLNVTTESRNFCLFLTWLPNPKNPPNTTYHVYCKFLAEKSWKRVPGCNNILETECNLTRVLQKNYSNLCIVRVRAVYGKQTSLWATLSNISYMFTVDPAPPVLHIIHDESHMVINVTLQEPPCMLANLNFLINYWLEITNMDNPHQKRPQVKLNRYSTTVNTSQYKGEHCMAVRTEFLPGKKMSEPSNSICLRFMQKGQVHYATLLTTLTVWLSVGFIVLIIGLSCIAWCNATQAKIPKVLEFSNWKHPPVVSYIPREYYHPFSIIENVEEASSIKHLLSNIDQDYPFNCCNYAARQPMQDDRSRGNSQTGESSSDEYTSSSSNKSSFDSSCVQTSGSSTEMVLTLGNIQLNKQSEDNNTIILGNNETLVPNNISMCPLLDTLHIKNYNDFPNVPLNTLSIGAGTNSLEYSDNESCNSEHTPDHLSTHSTDCGPSDSNNVSQPICEQKSCSSGYEQRGYMSRRC